MAGERSVARIVAEETRGQLERGLRLVGQLPHGPERYRLEAELLIALGRILLPTLGQTHPETRRVLERAVDVCRQIDDARMLARSLYALGIVAEVSDDVRTAEAIGAEFLALGTSTGDIGIAIAAHARLGPALFYQGRFVAARDTLSEGLALCVPGAYVALDVAVSSAPDLPLRAFLAPTSAYLGFADHAVACAEQAIERARQLGPTALAFALQHAIRTSVFLRDEAWCRVVAEMQMAIAEEQRLPYFLANARCALGWVRAQQGDVFDGLNMLTEGVATLEALGPTVLTSLVKCLISDAFVWAERRCDAMRALDDALTLSAATGAAWLDSELHRRKAELLISKDRYLTAAETEFREAVDIARRQSAKLFELRAGSGLARLLCALGRRAEANALLVPIYSWFTEEVDLPDLADARTLLSELASQA
jgi:tetratricopeptide (TPR) repeat protein